MNEKIIKKYYESSNYLVLCLMYLKCFLKFDQINENNIKQYNPGHLGTSMSINFILANLYYFLNKNNMSSKILIGTGHSGVSLIANLWLNGTLSNYYDDYPLNKHGLNNLIADFGTKIRSEINPQYPETIYDGGELGYSLGVAYGYSLNSEEDIIPCIIGDGEAETGTLFSSLQLNKLINSKSKVLPILNLNGLKMGSKSYFSKYSNKELLQFFTILGYQPQLIDYDSNKDIISLIQEMQQKLKNVKNLKKPFLIFKSKKGLTLPIIDNINYEEYVNVHKNPLGNLDNASKIKILKKFLENSANGYNIFDNENNLIELFSNFKTKNNLYKQNNFIDSKNYYFSKEFLELPNINQLGIYLKECIKNNNMLVFSPDEIYSNQFGDLHENTFEMLNENVLQSLYQGYVQNNNYGIYISYEGFMPIITSMISQYYKYLEQKKQIDSNNIPSLNYILTSTCWENTFSHQNPEFINSLLIKNDKHYNILFPKDGKQAILCMQSCFKEKNKINVITISKRHYRKYNTSDNSLIEVMLDFDNPEIILCATGDYMLDLAFDVSEKLLIDNIKTKIVYVTNPKILDVKSTKALDNDSFNNYFNPDVPVIYLFSGYSNIIKSILYYRNIDCDVYGYNDNITINGNLNNNLRSNGLSSEEITTICKNKVINPINLYLKRRK